MVFRAGETVIGYVRHRVRQGLVISATDAFFITDFCGHLASFPQHTSRVSPVTGLDSERDEGLGWR